MQYLEWRVLLNEARHLKCTCVNSCEVKQPLPWRSSSWIWWVGWQHKAAHQIQKHFPLKRWDVVGRHQVAYVIPSPRFRVPLGRLSLEMVMSLLAEVTSPARLVPQTSTRWDGVTWNLFDNPCYNATCVWRSNFWSLASCIKREFSFCLYKGNLDLW